MNTALTLVVPGVVLAIALCWMTWTVRQAMIARRGPNDSIESYLRHDKATGAVAMFVAISGVVITALLTGNRLPLAIWPAAILGVLVIIACEHRWPRPSGAIRTAPLIAPRRVTALIPWFGVVLSFVGVLAAAVVIGICWMIGDTPDGRTISGTTLPPDSETPNTVVRVVGFPGWTSGLITVLGGIALLAVVALGWRTVARRASLRTVPPGADLQFRRASIDRMVRILGIAAWLTATNFYESARDAYTQLHWAIRPNEPLTSGPAPWLPAVSAIAILILYVVARPRPRVPKTTTARSVSQPA